MSVYLRGQIYWCQFRVSGELIRLSTGKRDQAEAEKEARRLQVEKEQTTPTRRRGVGALETLSVWDAQTRSAEHTSEASTRRVEDLWIPVLLYFGCLSDPGTVTSESVYAYVRERRRPGVDGEGKRPVRNQTIRRELQALKRGLTEAKRRKWITDLPEPWPSLEKDPPHPRMRGKLHSEETIQAVVQELPPMAVDGVVFALATGLRLEELHRVNWANVRGIPKKIDGAAVAILCLPAELTKTRNERYVGLNRDAYDIAERRAEIFGNEIFPRYGYTQALKRTAKRLGLPPMNMRDMRHAFASTALRVSGGNLSAVAKAMGHSELEITTLYLHARDEDVLNLAATVITPDRSQRVERKTPGRVSAQELKEKMRAVRDLNPRPSASETTKTAILQENLLVSGLRTPSVFIRDSTICDHNARSHLESLEEGTIIDLEPVSLTEIMQGLPWNSYGPRSGKGDEPPVPLRGLAKVRCEVCNREAEVEDGPGIWECVFCGSGKVRVEV